MTLTDDLNQVRKEIGELLAKQLGLGEIETLDPSQLVDLDSEIEELIENWEQGPEMEDGQPEPNGDLQNLLRRYHELSELFLDRPRDR